MRYLKALHARHTALQECVQARHEFQGSVSDLVLAYQRRRVPVLACAAGVGFVLALAQLRVGRGLMRTGARIAIASGLAWHLLRQFIERRN